MMEEETIIEALQQNIPMDLTPGELELCKRATHCYICTKILTVEDHGVNDHCHMTDKYNFIS